jgi:hypothetical protein
MFTEYYPSNTLESKDFISYFNLCLEAAFMKVRQPLWTSEFSSANGEKLDWESPKFTQAPNITNYIEV